MDVDPLEPYGPLIETRLRLVTWNVWGRFGPWRERTRAVAAVLGDVGPDIVALEEVTEDQVAEFGMDHSAFAGDEGESGIAVVSRWPIRDQERRGLAGAQGSALRADVAGPRGAIHVFAVILDWRPHRSDLRREQVRQLAGFVREADRGELTIICGDFNAGPDSDEIRMVTGRTGETGVFWYDAWELAGDGPGITWSNANPWAAPSLMPDRRIDYVFSAWPRPGGAGHPLRAELVGTEESDGGVVPSDHYGVVADLRY
jgi:endonuclease/exonuclease/phosphatase family metal-dependent hydrolase